MQKALIIGWFSFEGCGATAGDLYARDLAEDWLGELGYEPHVALAEPFHGGVDFWAAPPKQYALAVFVCGPYPNNWLTRLIRERLDGVPLIGLNLSMLEPLADWNPFDALIERDSDAATRPDMTFLADTAKVPLVGVVHVDEQLEYESPMHGVALEAIEHLLACRDVASIAIDTDLVANRTGLRSPAQIVSVIARMDAVVTTRVHGTVFALKHGVAPLVIDPIAGGRKVLAHARAIGWKTVYTADALDPARLSDALDFCLSPAGRAEARRVAEHAVTTAQDIKSGFVDTVRALERPAEGGK